jgi:hypothetical protein
MSNRRRIQLRNQVESHAEHFDWGHMTRYYRVARRWAFQKHFPDRDILPAEPQTSLPAGPSSRMAGQVSPTRHTETDTTTIPKMP